MGPRAVLDAAVKRRIPRPRRQSNPRTPNVQPIAQRYTDRAIAAHLHVLVLIVCAVQYETYIASVIRKPVLPVLESGKSGN
jgi:hypothetical protein